MRARDLSVVPFLFVGVALAGSACTSPAKPVPPQGAGGAGGAGGDGGTTEATSTTSSSGGSGGATTTSSTGGSGGSNPCDNDLDVDDDKDGFTENEGDCNDCDPNTGPNAIEVPTKMAGDPADEDCDGKIDEEEVCDDGLMLASVMASDAAKAIEACKQSTGDAKSWGVVTAKWVRADGTLATPTENIGLPEKFGDNIVPRAGKAMLVMSSGHARDLLSKKACGTQNCSTVGAGTPPPSFPQDVPSCAGNKTINDDIAFELTVNAPSNAKGYSFEFAFISFEHPEYVCTSFNDQFIALIDPAPPGSINGNISFDGAKNPVSVNIALFSHCDPALVGKFAMNCTSTCPSPPMPYCPDGPSFMAGTGFNTWGDAGSTGWLTTTAPVEAEAQFKIRFAIWDTGDTSFDSTVLIDNFKWSAEPGTIGTNPSGN